MNKLIKRIIEIEYHRNGVCGAPFYVIKFDSTEGDRMLGIVFNEPYYVAVFNHHLLSQGIITFGINSFRGDHYEPELRQAIKKYKKTLR